MANGRNKNGRGQDSGRDPGGFSAIPWSVLDCPGFRLLSMHARALLLEVARQFVRDNNGRLLLSRAYMATRGWKSADMLTKAKAELLAGGFIFQTVMGHRPNKASWFAVTWRRLDRLPGFDEGAYELFQRGAYKKGEPQKNAVLRPPRGTRAEAIVPPHGTTTPRPVPRHGTVRLPACPAPVPHHGHHLDMPSTHVDSTHRDGWRHIELAFSAISTLAGGERAEKNISQLTAASVGAAVAPAPPPLRLQVL
jgi:hypothetical protein